MCLEILDKKDKVLLTHVLNKGLTLLGQSPTADIHLRGKGIGALHVGIKLNLKTNPVIMDLGGPTPLRINGKEALEQNLETESAILEIGSRRLRLRKNTPRQGAELRNQQWEPLGSEKKSPAVIRVRLFYKGQPQQVLNTRNTYRLSSSYGVTEGFKVVWTEGKNYKIILPPQWVALGGRIQVGSNQTLNLKNWSSATQLEQNIVYRVFAGPYCLEILISRGQVLIGHARPDFFPKDLRKPFAISAAAVLALFAFWMVTFGRPDNKIEEPYPVFARTQNIPMEKIIEPEKSNEPQAGGGAGSESEASTAPTLGAGAPSAPSRAAQALAGGLRNLIGNVLSQSKISSAVVAETGVGQSAMPTGNATQAGKLTSVGNGATGLSGATKLGKLSLAGSGQAFSGGSGTGLGTGSATGVGSGVGNGIGRGGYRLVEEESFVDGGLDKSVIAAVIQNNLSQIKYCYERQLVAEPDLFGKVVMLWSINTAGIVEGASVKQTTLNSLPVEKCMLSKISSWKFPQPKNGTTVTVSYPFLFKSTK